MATTATAPERKVSAAEAREVAEAAREQEWAAPSFVRDLFLGKFRLDLIHPYPEQDPEEVRRAQPRLAKGAISAFALTEPGVGSDPAAMETTAVPTPDGQAWILNGEKLWCTNGTKAELLVVIARTPSKVMNGKEKRQITAFIVETAWPGVKVEHRCHFMGLKAIYNGVMRFTNVRVPNENVLWELGKGVKLGLT